MELQINLIQWKAQSVAVRAHGTCQVNLLILLPEACCTIMVQSQMRGDYVQYIIIRCGGDWKQSVQIKSPTRV